jgi:hypothetical protein
MEDFNMKKDNRDLQQGSIDSTPEGDGSTTTSNGAATDATTEASKPTDLGGDSPKGKGAKAKKEKKPKKDKPKKPKKEKQPLNTKKLKYGTLATVLTVVVTAVVVAVNLIAQEVTERFDLTMDLTDDDIYSISEETTTYLESLDQDVQIVVLADESDFDDSTIYLKQASEVIKKYALYGDRVSVEFVDINKNPNYVTKFSDVYSGDLT